MSSPTRHVDAINGWDAAALENLYAQWQQDPGSLDATWTSFFRGFELSSNGQGFTRNTGVVPAAAPADPSASLQVSPSAHLTSEGALQRYVRDQMRVASLINHYRSVGHTAAQLDPLGSRPEPHPRLKLEEHNLSEADLDTEFEVHRLPLPTPSKLRDIVQLLQETYCRTIGVEFMYMNTTSQRYQFAADMESCRNRAQLSTGDRLWILQRLIAANTFETFLHRRYPSAKRFGLEGAEALIPLLDTIVEEAPELGVEHIQMAMAHRGRLNVLSNVLGKTYEMICTEFEDTWEEDFVHGGGDVKYHRGFDSTRMVRSGKPIELSLASNPSHLEAIYPVLMGRTRMSQDIRGGDRGKVLPIAMHGDAAFAGQGVVFETLQMSMLDGYNVGGTIHVVINNQIGFTTPPNEGRSTPYCSDIAKFLEAPIFHVNGNDPEAVVHCARMALKYRQQYKQDVVIDMYCYRLHGHNESDEPTFTQPGMYERIRKTAPVHQIYGQQLKGEGLIDELGIEQMQEAVFTRMDEAQQDAKEEPVDPTPDDPFAGAWASLSPDYTHTPVQTGVSTENLERIGDALVRYPDGFAAHKKVVQVMHARRKAIYEGGPIDWGTAEALAFGSLLMEGTGVRLSGQDVRRGTFSHRHAVLVDVMSTGVYTPLAHIQPGQANFQCINSHLSEFGVLGFEYGYTAYNPNHLTIWEAQFGDFGNGAQVIIDQFVASGEAKWDRPCHLVMQLPHGYEGQGPEHSSARLERYLQLCADDNMEVCYPTTPAQLFHMLRRQVRRDFRRPLIVMTPKSLLRSPTCVSTIAEFTAGHFHTVLDEAIDDPARVRRLLLCSGKVFYDLHERRAAVGRPDVAIVRVEQLFPFPAGVLSDVLRRYSKATSFAWVQEEPKNAGAWSFIEPRLRPMLGNRPLQYVGRHASASPAVGSLRAHKVEQDTILNVALEVSSGKADEPAEVLAERVLTAGSQSRG